MTGISVDQGRLEDLRKLSTFFDFISNPQAYKDFLTETQAVLGKMDATIAAYTTVECANEYFQAATAKVAEVNALVESTQVELAAQKEAFEAKIATETQALAELRTELEARNSATLVGNKQLTLQARAMEERQLKLQELEQTLGQRQEQLVAQEKGLAARIAKITALVGG